MDDKKQIMKVDDGAAGVRLEKVNYPSNSNKKKEKRDLPEKKVKKIIDGNVVQKKKSFSKRLAETFFGDDVPSVSAYIIHDVIIPATKSTISDMVSGGIEMLLFGETRGSRTRRDKGKSYVSYSNYYNRDGKRDERRDRDTSRTNRARHNFDDIILETRGDAEEVLSHLVDLTEDYGMASVADLYDLVGITANFTDNKYGWENLSTASISRVRSGYLIDLPKTILLD